jgi:hypothetical protein
MLAVMLARASGDRARRRDFGGWNVLLAAVAAAVARRLSITAAS